MFYPRKDSNGNLVSREQLEGYGEYLVKRHRIFFVQGVIGDGSDICDALIAMDCLSSDPIRMVVDSPGGVLSTTYMLYDTIKLLRSPVYTLGRECCSAAVLLLAAGAKRYLMPHSKVMLHLPSGNLSGDERDIEIQNRQLKKYKEELVQILLDCGAKKTPKQLLADMDRDHWLGAREAIDYGLADEVMTREKFNEWFPQMEGG